MHLIISLYFISPSPIPSTNRFAYNAGQFLQKFDLEGLEVAWQPPAWPSWDSGTAQRLSLLLLQLNNALKVDVLHPLYDCLISFNVILLPESHSSCVTTHITWFHKVFQ